MGRVNIAIKAKQRIDNKGKCDLTNFLYKIFKPYDFHKDFPDYDSDDTEDFYVNFPDEDPACDMFNKNKKLLSELTSNEKQ